MEKKEKKIYMKPSTEMFFVESLQLLEHTFNDGNHHGAEDGGELSPGLGAKGFDLWDEDSEALYGNPTIWDE